MNIVKTQQTQKKYKMKLLPCNYCYTHPWKLIGGMGHEWIQDAKTLGEYILPNDVWIDEDKGTGYLLAHIRYKDTKIKKNKYGDRHIHLFTFDPGNPGKLTHEWCNGKNGAFLSPTFLSTNYESFEEGGICEASLNVVGNTVYIHYVSWSNDDGVPMYSFRLKIPLGKNRTVLTALKVFNRASPEVVKFKFKGKGTYEKSKTAINVRYKDGIFYAINGNAELKASGLKLFNSTDGINFDEIQDLDVSGQDSHSREYCLDIGAHIEFLGEDKIWYVHYAHTDFIEGGKKEIRSHIFENKGTNWIKMPNYKDKVLVENEPPPYKDEKAPFGYSTAIDSPAIFKHGKKWYMFIAGSNTPYPLQKTPYADSKIYLFSCDCYVIYDAIMDESRPRFA